MLSSEDQLVKACLKGNAKQQKNLYQRYKVNLYMLCLRYARDRSEAEDFLQEGFIKIFQDLHQFNSEKGSLSTWTRRVTLNVIFQHLRKKRIQFSSSPIEDFSDQLASTHDILSDMTTKELMAVIQQLPMGYRVVFNMYILDGYTHKEIAEELGVSVSTSKSQLHKAKSFLRRQLNDDLMHTNKKKFAIVNSESRRSSDAK